MTIRWRRSSRSDTEAQGNCVEVSVNAADATLIRDSKNPDGPRLSLTRAELATLLTGIKQD